MIELIKKFENNKFYFITNLLLILLPVAILTSSLLINLFVIVIDCLFLYSLFINKNLKYLNNKYFYSLILIWSYLILNLFFSINFVESLPRSIGFIRFVIFAFALSYFMQGKTKKIIFRYWFYIFIFISIDLLVEFIFGENLFGIKSPFEGRLSGVMGNELKIGHYYYSFILISLIYIYEKLASLPNKKQSKYLFYLIFLFFICISFIIGERANFIRLILMSIIFIFLFDDSEFLKKIISLTFLLVFCISVTISKPYYKYRVWDMFLYPIINNPIKYINESKYGNHYKTAIEVFQNNKLFGVGLKNYRLEVKKDEYYKNDASIHPHQIHFELLSELGLLGYILIISLFAYNLYNSIKFYFKKNNKDKIQLCGILFMITTFIPLIPSGSFFTTYGAVLFWLNYALMLPKKK